MISFDRESARFHLRVVGVAFSDGRVLLSQAQGDDFYELPGGRLEMLESSEDGLRLTFRWFPIDDLPDVPLYPTFLRTALASPPITTELIVHRDGPIGP